MKMLEIDYSVKPSLISLAVETHPDRSDIAAVDIGKLTRVQMLRDGESYITGNEYLKRLKEGGQPMLDVRVMEELLKPENQHLIPEDWKKGLTYFFGTTFRLSDGSLYAPYLGWYDGKWYWRYGWLDGGWDDSEFGASLAVPQTSAPSDMGAVTLGRSLEDALAHIPTRNIPTDCKRGVCDSCAEMRGWNNAVAAFREYHRNTE